MTDNLTLLEIVFLIPFWIVMALMMVFMWMLIPMLIWAMWHMAKDFLSEWRGD